MKTKNSRHHITPIVSDVDASLKSIHLVAAVWTLLIFPSGVNILELLSHTPAVGSPVLYAQVVLCIRICLEPGIGSKFFFNF